MARRSAIREATAVSPRQIWNRLRQASKKPQTSGQISWREILGNIFAKRGMLLRANILALLSMMATICLPLLLPLLVDEIILGAEGPILPVLRSFLPSFMHTSLGFVAFITVLSVCLRFVGLGLDILQTRIFANIAKHITYSVRKRVLSYLQNVSMHEFEVLGSGKVANHLTTDIATIDDFIGQALSRFLLGMFSLVGVLVVMIWISPLLTLFLVVFNPFVAVFGRYLGKYIKQLKKKENASLDMFQTALTETMESVQQIRVSHREKIFFGRLTELADKVRLTSVNFGWRNDAAERLSTFVFMFGFDLFRALAILLVALTTLTIGQMFAMFGYLWFMLGSVQSILQIQFSFYSAYGALERINGLLNLPAEKHIPCRVNPFVPGEPASLEIKDLTFGYQPDKSILKNLSLAVAAGEKVGIRGESGCGKSTMVQVLLGLYRHSKGSMLFNRLDIAKIGYQTVRSNTATVLQHPGQLNTTVRVNLCLGKEHSERELWHALEIAQLADFVADMPDGLDSMVGNRGVRLSGGQRQRLAIARAALTRPSILILDEATSALDEATETKLHGSLNKHFHSITTLIIAHRRSALKQTDIVYTLADGSLLAASENNLSVTGTGTEAAFGGRVQTIR